VLIGAPLDRLETEVAEMRNCMAEASQIVLAGFELGTDAHVVKHPQRYMDSRGAVMWDRVTRLIAERQSGSGPPWRPPDG
jgi:DNA polymerase-1